MKTLYSEAIKAMPKLNLSTREQQVKGKGGAESISYTYISAYSLTANENNSGIKVVCVLHIKANGDNK